MPPKTAVTANSSIRPAAWWQRASTGQTIAAAIAFSVLIFILIAGLDLITVWHPMMVGLMIAMDGAVAALCGTLLLRIVRDAQGRHRMLMERLTMIGDLNHHVRNALESIQLTAHSTQNQELIEPIQNAVSRIQSALREIVPEPGNYTGA